MGPALHISIVNHVSSSQPCSGKSRQSRGLFFKKFQEKSKTSRDEGNFPWLKDPITKIKRVIDLDELYPMRLKSILEISHMARKSNFNEKKTPMT